MGLIKYIKYLVLSFKKSPWSGNYKSWQEAITATNATYENPIFFEKLVNSSRLVKDGTYPYERDTVLFNKIEYSWPVLSSLLYVFSNASYLEVLDFGGGLGSSFIQNKKFLAGLGKVHWNIVEQEKIVNIGKIEFGNEMLHFYPSIDECIKERNVNVILLSSVVQYIQDPYQLLDIVLKSNVRYLIIDRLMVSRSGFHEIKVQNVSNDVYEAKIPCHFFAIEEFESKLEEKFSKVEEWFLDNETTKDKVEKGMLWIRN